MMFNISAAKRIEAKVKFLFKAINPWVIRKFGKRNTNGKVR